ncbi:MAG: metallophosphoesterase [Verrucomicrobia bacterium]|nr:metallophosphoesterase [Verrucomicrobiota bacterium]
MCRGIHRLFVFLSIVSLLIQAPVAKGERPFSGRLKALVYENPGGGRPLSKQLEAAGFKVRKLPDFGYPRELKADLVVLGSFSADDEGYPRFCTGRTMREQTAFSLLEFVTKGGVLLELPQQETQRKGGPPFSPEFLEIEHSRAGSGDLYVVDPDHILVRGFPMESGTGKVVFPGTPRQPWIQDAYETSPACREVLRTGSGQSALLEGKVAEGRMLFSSAAYDLLEDEKEDEQTGDLRSVFFKNLYDYVLAHKRGALSDPAQPGTPPLPSNSNIWSLVIIPDTQKYSQKYPSIFDAQTEWIKQVAREKQVAYVLHVGDFVELPTEMQWENARRSMSRLRGVVGSAVVLGNHDYDSDRGEVTRRSQINRYLRSVMINFPGAKICSPSGWYKRGELDNAYYEFEAGGREWIILALEYGPRDQVVDWANTVLDENPDKLGILLTHAYLHYDDTRFDLESGKKQTCSFDDHPFLTLEGGVNEGEKLWKKLVSPHRNMRFVFCGHVLGDGIARLASRGVNGNVVHQMLVNYQMNRMGGEGFLRILEFQPDGNSVYVKTYSPFLDVFKTDEENQFILDLNAKGYYTF